jgi:flagellar FliL protein
MKKILGLLPRIGMIVLGVILVSMVFFMAYIMFAPDSFPKPFHLVYFSGSEEAAVEEEPTTPESHGKSSATKAEEPVEGPTTVQLEMRPGQGIMLDTGSKIVNLVDPTGRKYLRVGIVLEFAPTDLKYYTMEGEEKTLYNEEFKTELNSMLPVINDIIITLLSSQTYESVYTAQGKEALRVDLMNKINAQLPEHRVIFVYFTEFVVQ